MNGCSAEKGTFLQRMHRVEGGEIADTNIAEAGASDGVTDVAVDLPTGAVTSDRPVDDARVRAAVEEAGYTLAG